MRFLIIILLPILIFSYEWTPSQRVGNGTTGHSRFALDCFDRLWCIFDSSATIKASRYLDSLWSDPVSVYAGVQATGVGGFDATRAKKGKLWVLTSNEYNPPDPAQIAIYYDGNIWSAPFVIPVSIYQGTHFRLAADSIGKVWAVFDGWEDYRIWYDFCEDTVWYGAYVVCSYPTYDQVTCSNITINPKGIRWASATAVLTPSGNQIFLCRSDSTGTWSDSLIIGPTVSSGRLRDITSDNVGNIWIAWDNWDEDRIYTAYLDTNLNWSPYYQITQFTGEFGWCNLAVDDENNVWIVYDKSNNFYFRVWNGNQWSPEDSIVTSPASSAFHGAVFYDPIRDRIWISFKTGGDDIYTTWTNPSSGIEEQRQMLEAICLKPEIYPNPAKSFLAVRLSPTTDRQIIKIFDVSGKMVKEIATASEFASQSIGTRSALRNDKADDITISLKGINPGIYFIRLNTGENRTIKKVVIF